ncbi:GNAT family N-acetyltransferase [Paracoccaceae bacterium GXU_MW_L88]
MTETLTTERLVLRRSEGKDWPQFHAFALSERSKGIGGPHNLKDAWRKFAYGVGHWQIFGFGMWIVTTKEDDTALALVGPWSPPDWPENEIGWMVLDPAFEGKGYAFEAARAALEDAYTRLGWTTAVSYIDPDNTRSRALAERLGAVIDPNAAAPGTHPSLVYRHPAPQEAA